MDNELKKLLENAGIDPRGAERIGEASKGYNTFQDMTGDAGFINLPNPYGIDILVDLEDIAYGGGGGMYDDNGLEEVDPLDGPIVPAKLLEKAEKAIERENVQQAEKAIDSMVEYWFEPDEDYDDDEDEDQEVLNQIALDKDRAEWTAGWQKFHKKIEKRNRNRENR